MVLRTSLFDIAAPESERRKCVSDPTLHIASLPPQPPHPVLCPDAHHQSEHAEPSCSIQ